MSQETKWLPSEQIWIDGITDRVLTGEIILVRSLPRWGLTSVCAAVKDGLGSSAVSIAGRSMDETTQRSKRELLDKDVTEKIERDGFAQLIFDDYGHAIRRSQGGALHSMLFRLLVDSSQARDTGALLVARSGDLLDLNFAGSPLLSRATSLALPILADDDASAIGLDLKDLRSMVGESTWLARRLLGCTVHEGRINAVEHLTSDRRRILGALPADAVEVLAGARTFNAAGPVSQEALRSLGTVDEGHNFQLGSFVAQSKLLEEIQVESPGWPRGWIPSVERFAELLAGAGDAIWVDRYALSAPSLTRRFLDDLRRSTSTRLRILISDDRTRPSFAQEIVAALEGVSRLEVRIMHRADRIRLHDRHLVLPAMKSGFVLPTAGVILGQDQPGSAVSVPIPSLAIDYSECWNRAAPVFPAAGSA